MSSNNLLLRLPAELRIRIYHQVLNALPEEHRFALEKSSLELSWEIDAGELNCFVSAYPYLDKRKDALLEQGIQHFHGRLLGLAAICRSVRIELLCEYWRRVTIYSYRSSLSINAKIMMEGLDPAVRSRLKRIRAIYYGHLKPAEEIHYQGVVDMGHVHPELQIEFSGPRNFVFVKSDRGKDLLANST